VDRLPVLKALGDNTRYAIYLEVARAASPRSTAEIAESLGLHPNTVRPHLERMRDVGLLDVEIDSRGTVGRPQHRYAIAADAPGLGLEPPAFPLLARMLGAVAATAGVEPDDLAAVGREQGRAAAVRRVLAEERLPETAASACLGALVEELEALGFDPAVGREPEQPGVTVAFTHCPYRELAEAYPDLVCHLHRGMVEGFVESAGGAGVVSFGTLTDRRPCEVVLAPLYHEDVRL
jgi:predicted ArsR family transcriptional regulator